VLCREAHVSAVAVVVQALAKKEAAFDLKENCGLSAALDTVDMDNQHPTLGWLELENGYFFFTDKDMFKQVVLLFTGKEYK
jgi:hypothetical protein